MAQARDLGFNPSSPHSSSGCADSYKHEGTPDTRLTAFSPDDNSAGSNKLLNRTLALSTASSQDAHSHRFHSHTSSDGYSVAPASGSDKDPFVSTSSISKQDQKLSPTASSFLPVSVSGPLVAHGSVNGPQNGMQGLLNTVQPSYAQQDSPKAADKLSTDLNISRYLVFYSSQPIRIAGVEEYLRKLERLGSPVQGKHHSIQEGVRVLLRLTDIRDARKVHDNAQLGNPDWRATYIAPVDFFHFASPGASVDPVSEGQLLVLAFPGSGYAFPYAQSQVEAIVYNFLQDEGELFAFQRLTDSTQGLFKAIVEFSDVDVAVAVVSKFNGFTVNGIQLLLTLCQPDTPALGLASADAYNNPPRPQVQDITNIFQNMSVARTPQSTRPLVGGGRVTQSPASISVPQQQIAMYPVVYQTPINSGNRYVLDQTPTRDHSVAPLTPLTPISGGLSVMSSSIYTPPATPMAMQNDYTSPRSMQQFGRPDGRRQNAMRVSRSPYHNAAGHHNHVDVNRIREGIDVRTTIMLRNIPNKVDQAMLKRIIDESSWGKYDFMYLRIDFANDCNVGYAFINFVDPLDIVDFVNTRGNQRWNCFKSDKVAEISYATIQGKDCLVQKFRNSSVMLEAPHYRPKLYFTSNGPRPDLAGQEEPFPEPDNQSKMKRSCENAEHVGLFTPNAGQNFRDEQRRRRSQYDRGTRLAALEEYDYDTQTQPQAIYPAQ
ncbi:hypothetical protein GE21DRAFT_4404 [Neurospora crassa]|uniref:RRM domain-containing protein n=1 Tax=Neurospora crassa (strain ATCC 24698 / 74-OR23-1A / CBS 708.71 / DSM 1257 / FGSC 987) TaxID=367110 RepID=Q7RYL1_NEUCR|nr:hypothetical protein NCU00118 [Neurospora crassa OR74A]EAA28006.3 hypothetical protein NCU00118 [Neurospora crassa OR74A]KHE89485.1 hypothetical protein GE21DRAFT_4404 [Neurospora crassa]|eukprot:XP_957242.3 hypothetical protein NCU00118 [Neurospora crassa OR74A]